MKKKRGRFVIEWKTRSGFGSPDDGQWGEFCIVQTQRKPDKYGEAQIIVASLNTTDRQMEYRLRPHG